MYPVRFDEILKAMMNTVDNGLILLDGQGNILLHNQKALDILQISDKSLTGRHIHQVIRQDTLPHALCDFKCSANARVLYVTNCHGKRTRISLVVSVIPGKDNTVGASLLSLLPYQATATRPVSGTHTPQPHFTFDSILGDSVAITQMKHYGKCAAGSDSSVLILGESGTGKELLAQSIHNASCRRDKPFIAINCGAIPDELIESELFGYEHGAFTGAKQSGSPGKFELADGGTLFLDEIGDMPLALQASLLRVLQSREITRIGGLYPKPVDVRIIAATNIDLLHAVESNKFRSDLYYRLNILSIKMPPLREHAEDIPLLAAAFIDKHIGSTSKKECTISDTALQYLGKYHWPGNIRELENIIERALCLTEKTIITEYDLPEYIINTAAPSFPEHSTHFLEITPHNKERFQIVQLLREEKGHVSSVAQRLNIPVSTLYRKMKKYNIIAKEFKVWNQQSSAEYSIL